MSKVQIDLPKKYLTEEEINHKEINIFNKTERINCLMIKKIHQNVCLYGKGNKQT